MAEARGYNPSTQWVGRDEEDNQEKSIFFTIVRQQGVTSTQLSFLLKDQSCHTLPLNEIEEIYYHPNNNRYAK